MCLFFIIIFSIISFILLINSYIWKSNIEIFFIFLLDILIFFISTILLIFNIFVFKKSIISPKKVLKQISEKEELINNLKKYSSIDYNNLLFINIFDNLKNWIILMDNNKNIIKSNISSKKIISDIISDTKFNDIFKKTFILNKKISNIFYFSHNYYSVISIPFIVDKHHQSFFIFENVTEHQQNQKNQDEFIASISHELKTPISAVLLSLESLILANSKLKNDDDILILQRQATKISNIIESFISYSNSKYTENIFFHKTEESVSSMINESIHDLSHEIKQKKAKISIDCEPQLLWCDKVKIVQSITNILKNSLFYCNNIPNINIVGKKMEKKYYIEIEDNGLGIAKKNLPFIFDKFYRVAKDRNNKTGGQGIGLSIVKSFIDLHDGKIKIESKLHIGTKITIIFNTN